MLWWQFALLGTIGGAAVEVLAIFCYIAAWQDARRKPSGTLKRTPPAWDKYIDLPLHAIMLPARAMLGAGAATLFGATGQITGSYGAVACGCAAPVLLARLGSIPQVAKAVNDISADRKTQAEAPVVMAGVAGELNQSPSRGETQLP